MREEIYQQIREFGVIIENFSKYEKWIVHDSTVMVFFTDSSHKQIDYITI